jgi:hypothetical protein
MSDFELTSEDGIYDLEEQKSKFYQEIGRFITTFEHILSSFTNCISAIFRNKGLKDALYSTILLGEATADPIRIALERISFYYFDDKSTQECILKILTQMDYLNQIRNKFVHSLWAIGVTVADERKPFAIGLKSRLSKKGISMYNLSLGYDILLELNLEMRIFNTIANDLYKAIDNKKSINVEEINSLLKNLKFREKLDIINNEAYLSISEDKKSVLVDTKKTIKNGKGQKT